MCDVRVTTRVESVRLVIFAFERRCGCACAGGVDWCSLFGSTVSLSRVPETHKASYTFEMKYEIRFHSLHQTNIPLDLSLLCANLISVLDHSHLHDTRGAHRVMCMMCTVDTDTWRPSIDFDNA